MDIDRYRDFFPVTKTDVYLNHAAISPFSTRVQQAISDYLQVRSAGNVDIYPAVIEKRLNLKRNIGKLINGAPEQIAIVTNTSEGLNWLANGLDWQPGDRIMLFEGEFPSNIYPFLNLKRFGVEVDFVSNRNGKIFIEDIEKAVTPRTRLLSISFVEFLNGFRNDLKSIGELCRRHDIIFSVDGIQGIGALPFDVQAAQIDFVSCGGHKWLMSPLGCGFMYIAPQLHEKLKPVFAGWLGVKDGWNFLDYRLDFLDDAGRYEIATANFMGMYGAEAATGLLVEAGPENTEKHLLQLGKLIISEMQTLDFRFTGSELIEQRSGIYSFERAGIEDLLPWLEERKIHVAVRNGALRIAPHFYNNEDDILRLVEAVKSFLKK